MLGWRQGGERRVGNGRLDFSARLRFGRGVAIADYHKLAGYPFEFGVLHREIAGDLVCNKREFRAPFSPRPSSSPFGRLRSAPQSLVHV